MDAMLGRSLTISLIVIVIAELGQRWEGLDVISEGGIVTDGLDLKALDT
jgi:hypothetical protein